MTEMTNNKCTLKAFTNGIKPAFARWRRHNKRKIEVAVYGIGYVVAFALVVLVAYLVQCVMRLWLGGGTNTTEFVGYAVFITLICLAIYLTIRRLMQVVKACCVAGQGCMRDRAI